MIMHQMAVAHAVFLASSASASKTFHIGPWIIVPLLLLLALIATPVFIVRDRRKRRSAGPAR
jgi:hypothetical protein